MKLKNNGLIIADLHIKKDERFSPEGTINYRLEQQPMMLLDRMEELIANNSIGWVAILGDLLDTSACLPQELHVLDRFLSRMNRWGFPILIILGQHDVDSNRYDGGGDNYFERSNVTALIEHYNNIYYAHNTYGTINDKYSYYLSNFSDPLIYPDKYIDLWMTHCNLGFTHVEEWDTDSKNVKFNRKFGIMVAGDIHEHYQIGNCYTVGTPYQHKAHEQQTGVIGLIKDTGEKLEFSRVLSDTESRKFLRFEPPNKNIVIKDEKGKEIQLDVSQKNILDQIENKVNELGLTYIHKKISKTSAPNPVNFNFRLTKLIIDNYKSCKHFELDFTTFKKTLFLQGKYGSGKSTIVEALRDVFCGDTKTIDSKVMYGTQNCRLQVDLEYEYKIYTIVRGKSLLEFYINGEQQSANNMKGLEALIELALPFIPYLYLFLPHSNERLFDSEKGLELFQRCFNLDVFDYYLDSAVKLKKLFNEENNTVFSSVKVKEGERNILQAEVDKIKNNIEESKAKTEGDYDKLVAEKEGLKQVYDRLTGINSTLKELNDQLYKMEEGVRDFGGFVPKEEIEQKVVAVTRIIEEIENDNTKRQVKKLLEERLKNTREQYALLSKSLKQIGDVSEEPKGQLEQNKKDLEEFIANNSNKLTLLKHKDKEKLEKDLLAIQNGILQGDYICPTCGQRVVKDVSDLKIQKVEVEKQLKDIKKKIEEIEQDLGDANKDKVECETKLETIEAIKHNVEVNKQLKEIKIEGERIKKELDAIIIQYTEDDLEEKQALLKKLEDGLKIIKRYEDTTKRILVLQNEENEIKNKHGDIQSKIDELDNKISYHTIYKNYIAELEVKQAELDECVAKIEELSAKYNEGVKQLTDWDTYISLMDYNNLSSIPYKLINLLINNFNTDSFKISTTRAQKNGKEKFVIDLLIKDENSKYWVPYMSQSGGQKLLSELYLYDCIANFMGGIGILSLDENLNTASVDLYPLLNDIIGRFSYNNLILVSHSQQISSFDKKITVYLNQKHESCYA